MQEIPTGFWIVWGISSLMMLVSGWGLANEIEKLEKQAKKEQDNQDKKINKIKRVQNKA